MRRLRACEQTQHVRGHLGVRVRVGVRVGVRVRVGLGLGYC